VRVHALKNTVQLRRPFTAAIVVLLCCVSLAGRVAAETVAAPAADPKLAFESMVTARHWREPREPAHILGPLYFVGTKGFAVWLITTPKGHILVNSGLPELGPLVEASIRKLGFDPADIELILTGHAHRDHAGSHAYMKKISGAQVVALDAEVDLLASGGKTDFQYGALEGFRFEPVTADRVVHDGEKIELGDVVLTARRTAGHTKGSTTWLAKIAADGNPYDVVFADGTVVNPGYRLVNDPSYPGIADDYRRTFNVLGTLKPDIWLTSQTDAFDLEGKLARAVTEGSAAWVDRAGYQKWLGGQRIKFHGAVEQETEAAAK
jgi:metallo-beta-lactamase class B